MVTRRAVGVDGLEARDDQRAGAARLGRATTRAVVCSVSPARGGAVDREVVRGVDARAARARRAIVAVAHRDARAATRSRRGRAGGRAGRPARSVSK